MISLRTMAIAGITLGAVTAAAIAAGNGHEPSAPLGVALVLVALLGVSGRRRGVWPPAQLETAARVHYEVLADSVRPRWCPWESLPSRLRAAEIAATRAAFEAAEDLP